MATLTYCKGLPTPVHELNELGFTDFEMFLEAYAPIFRAASIETVDHAKRKWQNSKTGCNLPIACSLQHKSTNWQNLRFQIHNKKRKLTLLTKKTEYLNLKLIKVFIPRCDIFVFGSVESMLGCCQVGRTVSFINNSVLFCRIVELS